MVSGESEATELKNFMAKIGVSLIPCDDLIEGVRGFLAFGGDAVEIWFGWKFAEPLKVIVVEKRDVENSLTECLDNKDWKCEGDDPKNMMIGYVNRKIGECRRFSIMRLNYLTSPSLRHRFIVHRERAEVSLADWAEEKGWFELKVEDESGLV